MSSPMNSHNKIPTIFECDSKGRENQSVAVDLDGSLLIDGSSFPYFALIAFDVGGILRLLLLILVFPVVALLYHLVSESAGIRVLIFATFAGVKVSDIKSAAKAVLPKHYSEDLHPETWRVLSSCGRKCVITVKPRIMVEPFLKNNLGVDVVLGTEISSYKGIATGFVATSGCLVGKNKAIALGNAFQNHQHMPNIGIGTHDCPFMRICKENYVVPRRAKVRPVSPGTLPKPVIFHDGRLVKKPTPLIALIYVLYFPMGVFLSTLRIVIGCKLPLPIFHLYLIVVGWKVTIKGIPPPQAAAGKGTLYVLNHRTIYDATIVSACLRRMITVVSYSISRLSELLSPTEVTMLTRDRTKDAKLIKQILIEGKELVVCPEGTTCREPYILRFSSLFAELTDQIVPVAVDVKVSWFYGTTVRGNKWLDPFFFAMNPRPSYEVTFLNKLSPEQTCMAGKSSYEVANNVQQMIAGTLGFKCTNLTRKDKYRALAGTDGFVE